MSNEGIMQQHQVVLPEHLLAICQLFPVSSSSCLLFLVSFVRPTLWAGILGLRFGRRHGYRTSRGLERISLLSRILLAGRLVLLPLVLQVTH